MTTTTPNAARKWNVLLIGGSSGTGKTTLAPKLASYFGVAAYQADDFRLVLQRATTAAQQPALHFFLTDGVWRLPPEVLCKGLIEVAEVLCQALEIVIAHHLATHHPLIIEGDAIVPAMAVRRCFAGVAADGHVRSVFLYDSDEEALLRDMLKRGRGIRRLTPEEQHTQARAALLYGQWLSQEAQKHGLPLVHARPRNTLLGRVLAAIAEE